MEDLTTLLSNFPFPIVAFLICCYALKYFFDRSLEMNNKTLDKITTLSEAINNNTVVLTKLVERVEGIDEGNKN